MPRPRKAARANGLAILPVVSKFFVNSGQGNSSVPPSSNEGRLSICMFTQNFLPKIGGLELAVHYLADELAVAGNSVTVLTRSYPKRAGRTGDGNYDVAYFGAREIFTKIPGMRRLAGRFALVAKFLNLHRQHRFQLMHAHSASRSSSQAKFLAKLVGIPLVITSHGEDVLVNQATGYGESLLPKRNKVIRRNLARAHTVISVSERVHEVLRITVPTSKIVAISNGVRVRDFSCREKQRAQSSSCVEENIRALMVGRNVPVKGFEVALEALSLLVEEFPRVSLVHAGRNGRALVNKARENNLQRNFVHLGEVAHNKLPTLYCESDIFLLPSFSEASPLVLLEAMAAGLPPVITESAGGSSLVEHGHNGYVVAPGSATEIAEALADLISNSKKRRVFGCLAKNRAKDFDWAAIARKHVEVYRDMV